MTFQNPNEPTKSNGSQHVDGMQRMMGAVMNAIYSRSRFMLSRGGRYDGEADPRRNIGAECGWPAAEDVTPEAMGDMYDRFAVAARVNDLFPEECWQVTPKIYEDEDPQALTPFEEALDDLAKQLRGESFYEGEEGNPLFEHLLRMDRLCSVGSYGVMLLGLDDGKDLNEPADGLDETGKMSGNGGGDRKLLFLREFDERLAPVSTWETERENPRYGQPTSYNLTFDDPKLTGAKGSGRATETVHWTRVVHVADNLTTSDVFGVPRMRPVYNDLLDLRKLYGGSAEMYWQGAFPGVGFKTDPQLGADVAFPTDFADTMEKYMNGLQRWLAVGGVEPRMLSPTVVSPEVQIKVHLEAICVRLGVPLRIFLGSERGELASSQDSRAWNGRIQQRQNRFLTPRLLVPVVDRLISLGVLPRPAKYMVEWPDISEKTDQEKLDAALKKTQALAAYVQGGLESVVTPMAYFTTFLDFTEEEAASILEEAEVNVAEKLALDLPPIGQEFAKPEPAMPFGGAPGQGQMVGEDGQPLPPEDQIDAEAELKKQDLEEPKGAVPPQFMQNTFCATGEGGGVDPTCSPGEASGGGVRKYDQIKEGKMGKGAFVMPDGELIDVTGDFGGGTNDHVGVFVMAEKPEKFGLTKALVKKMNKEFESGDYDAIDQAWQKVYDKGIVRVRSFEGEVGKSASLDFRADKVSLAKVQSLVEKGTLPKVKDYYIQSFSGNETFQLPSVSLESLMGHSTWGSLVTKYDADNKGSGLRQFLAENALPSFLQKDAAEEDVEEQDALLEEPELDPLTGEPVEPEIDPLTGEPVDVDPLTGEPIDGAGDPYQALLDEVAPTLEVRGGLLPSDHKPSLRDRLTRAGDEEGAGTATFDEDGTGTATFDEEYALSEGEEPLDEKVPGKGEKSAKEEYPKEDEEEETRNAARKKRKRGKK